MSDTPKNTRNPDRATLLAEALDLLANAPNQAAAPVIETQLRKAGVATLRRFIYSMRAS